MVVPAVKPVTIPVEELIVAVAVLLLLHTCVPVVASLSVSGVPVHIVLPPVMGDTVGMGLTEITAVVDVAVALVTVHVDVHW